MLRFDELLLDCELYNGYKPCEFGNRCGGCVQYRTRPLEQAGKLWSPARDAPALRKVAPEQTTHSIVIIKTGALGDVLRTTTLLPNLHRTFPETRVTWVTDRTAIPLLVHTPLIERVVAIQDREGMDEVLGQTWSLLINLEKEPEPLELAARVSALRAVGFAPTRFGKPTIFNAEARLGLLLGLDDEFKFHRNTMSYPQIVATMCGLEHQRDPYVLELGPKAIKARQDLLRRVPQVPSEPNILVGLNTGCGTVFRTKQWLPEHWTDLARRLASTSGVQIVVLGGPAEASMNEAILRSVPQAVDGGANQPLEEFTGLVDACDLLVSSDTLGMHVAIARQKPVIALFGSTSSTEIDLFDRGEKVVTDFPCSPCYKRNCDFDPWCMEKLLPERIESAVHRWLSKSGNRVSWTSPKSI